ncbi:hypothetical protein [Bacillus sp. RCC_6_1]|uniref:hypothetical protein n=1 Tax=Bacillus sp. RCC_6_1 TaxID=3239229 RepID=UPI0035245302
MKIYYDNEVDFETLKTLESIMKTNGDTIKIETYGNRKGALDLITSIELFGILFATKMVTKITDGFVEGLINKEYFNQLGEKVRDNLSNKLSKLYTKIVSNYKDKKQAIVIKEYYNNTCIFAVINHYEMTPILLSKLPLAFTHTFNLIEDNKIPNDSLGIIQLFPNFEEEEWNYAFIPTINAYGNYIDRYYDFNEDCIYRLSSAEEFIVKFNPNQLDSNKYMIDFNRITNKKYVTSNTNTDKSDI